MSIPNKITELIGDLVPDELQGTDRYLDIITWNIKFFNKLDRERINLLASIIKEINADIFVLQEVSSDALDPVAEILRDERAGFYETAYGKSGGDIRVAFLYNTEKVSAKENITELFKDETLITSNGKKAFLRLPLHRYFQANVIAQDPIDFELVGLHMKSQRGRNRSLEQRRTAAERLVRWIERETYDEDLIIIGDWNATLDKPEWASIRELEESNQLKFADFNPSTEISHLYGRTGSRLDLIVVSTEAEAATTDVAQVISWNDINLRDMNLRNIIKDNISDSRIKPIRMVRHRRTILRSS